MSITSVEAVILRAIGESEFAARLISNLKETLSEYKLGEPELKAVEGFAKSLSLATTTENGRININYKLLGDFWM